MPFRLHNEGFPDRTKIQFTTSVHMPYLIYRACKATGIVSNTVYCQRALCEALARDLGIPLDDLLAHLPQPRGPAAHLYDPAEGTMNRFGTSTRDIRDDQSGGQLFIGPANTIEEVR
jgi:hypothetical protein